MITFMSRSKAKDLITSGFLANTVLISISNDEEEAIEMQNLEGAPDLAVYAVFQDIDSEESGLQPYHCNAIIEMAQYAVDNKLDVVVHCLAGVSRSGAVAKWINDYLAKRPDHYLTEYKGYNRYVYERMESAYGVSLADYYRNQHGN